jgi:hypothetical protein
MMIPSISDKRPPFVRFEEREMGLNPVATEKEGRPIPRVVFLACVTPHGSKDVVEKVADTWLAELKQKALRGEYPIDWYNQFDMQFTEWRKGNDLPREGTPIKTWAMATREQATRLIGNGITVVEDLAAFPDSNLSVIGMDGRYLRDLAAGWINEAKDKGINSKALADANVKINDLTQTISRQSERIERLEQRLESGAESKRGRSRKDESEAA